MQRMKTSPTKDRTPLENDTVLRALGIQWPSWSLFQKKETGVHSKVLAPKAAIVQRSVYIQMPPATRRNVLVGNSRT